MTAAKRRVSDRVGPAGVRPAGADLEGAGRQVNVIDRHHAAPGDRRIRPAELGVGALAGDRPGDRSDIGRQISTTGDGRGRSRTGVESVNGHVSGDGEAAAREAERPLWKSCSAAEREPGGLIGDVTAAGRWPGSGIRPGRKADRPVGHELASAIASERCVGDGDVPGGADGVTVDVWRTAAVDRDVARGLIDEDPVLAGDRAAGQGDRAVDGQRGRVLAVTVEPARGHGQAVDRGRSPKVDVAAVDLQRSAGD